MNYPILAQTVTWYKGATARSNITQIDIVDSYTATGNEIESWNADANNSGSIKCYITGTVLTIAGNGSGKIAANTNSQQIFFKSSDPFSSVTAINGLNLIDTSSVTNLLGAFGHMSSLTSIDLSGWDVSNVTTMVSLFIDCSSLTEIIGISNWNVGNLTTMKQMFSGCISLISLDLSNWNTGNVTDMKFAFGSTSEIGTMALTTIGDTSNWNTSKVTDFSYMFQLCSNLTEIRADYWSFNSATDTKSMFNGCTSLTTVIISDDCNTGNVSSMNSMFNNCKSLISLDLSNWNTGNVTDMSQMFSDCESLTTLDVSNWNTGNVTTMASMFNNCKSLRTINVSNWNTGNVTNMSWMFNKTLSLTVLDVSNWDTSKVTTFGAMFQQGDLGKECNTVAELDVSNWDVSSATDMSFMFYGMQGPRTIDVSKWNVSNVVNFDHMFAHSGLSIGDVSNWTNSIATNMHCMFHTVNEAILNISNLRTSNVIAFSGMFKWCYNLQKIIGLENFDTSKGVAFHGMFYECQSIQELDLSSFDTTNAKDGIVISGNGNGSETLHNMFGNNYKLKKITLSDKFSFNGDGTTTDQSHIAVLPVPNPEYISGADGKWYTLDGANYSSEEIPDDTACTYYAINPNKEVRIQYSTLVDIADAIRLKTGSEKKYFPSDMAEAIVSIILASDIESAELNLY